MHLCVHYQHLYVHKIFQIYILFQSVSLDKGEVLRRQSMPPRVFIKQHTVEMEDEEIFLTTPTINNAPLSLPDSTEIDPKPGTPTKRFIHSSPSASPRSSSRKMRLASRRGSAMSSLRPSQSEDTPAGDGGSQLASPQVI